MSKRRRLTYLGIMIVGAVALAIDRCVLPAPTIAPKSAVAVEQVPSPAQPPIESASPSVLGVPELPFPRNLNSYRSAHIRRDIFSPSNAIRRRQDPNTLSDKTGSDVVKPSDDPGGAETFSARHALEGVMLYDGLKIAVIDGAWVRIGQKLDGCRLERITGREAHFQCDDGRAVLRVADKATFHGD